MPQPWSRTATAALFSGLAALAIRLIVGVRLAGTPFTQVLVGDSQSYQETAQQILDGRYAEIGVFFQAPLYPFFLALLGVPGWGVIAVVQVLLAGLACAALASLAAQVFPGRRAVPWLAGFGAAACAPLVFFDLEVLPASLAVSFLILGVWLGIDPGGSRARDFAAGLLMGAAALLAPALLGVLLMAALLPVFMPTARRPGALARTGFLVAGALILILPVTLHNQFAGDFVLISSNGGVNAFIGNNPQATGAFALPAGSGLDGTRLEASARAAAERAAGQSLDPSEVSAHWARQAVDFATSEPLAWGRLLGRKILLAINHYEIPNHLNLQFVASRFVRPLEFLLPFWIVFPLAGLGGLVAWRASTGAGRLVVGAAILCLAVPVLFFVTARYRLPAVPFLLVLAAGGTAWLVEEIQARRWKKVVGGVALIVVLFLPTRLERVREGDFAFDHLLLGTVQGRLGELDAAVLEFKLAEETGPAATDAGYRLARVLEARGNPAAAAVALRRHLARHPGDLEAARWLEHLIVQAQPAGATAPPQTDFERATAHDRGGDLEAAATAFRRAIRADPAHGWAWGGLGSVRGRQGRRAEAIEALQRAVQLEPGRPVLWSNLAVVLFQAGRKQDALLAAQRCLELDPTNAEAQAVAGRARG